MDMLEELLKATGLCDFDRCGAVRETAGRVTEGSAGDQERLERVYRYVKELPYGLEDWDVRASETLVKGWGMCCGKTNLMVAMLRSLSIPARYRIFKAQPEPLLVAYLTGQGRGGAMESEHQSQTADHVQGEAWVGGWQVRDPSRDSALERGLRRLGIPLERIPAVSADGLVHFEALASIDDWARSRQAGRNIREQRESVFARVNGQFEKIRQVGRTAL